MSLKSVVKTIGAKGSIGIGMGLGAVAGARGVPYLGRQEFNAMSAQDRRQTRLGGAIAGAAVGAGIGAIAQYYMNKEGEPEKVKNR